MPSHCKKKVCDITHNDCDMLGELGISWCDNCTINKKSQLKQSIQKQEIIETKKQIIQSWDNELSQSKSTLTLDGMPINQKLDTVDHKLDMIYLKLDTLDYELCERSKIINRSQINLVIFLITGIILGIFIGIWFGYYFWK
jgi:hypothetical protein